MSKKWVPFKGKKRGMTYMVISPNSTFGIGNSIGGYFVRQDGGRNIISLVRVSGSEKNLPLDQLKGLIRDRKGVVLRPGMLGLWATSSGSARRGLYHKYSPPDDPTEMELAKVAGSTWRLILHRVPEIKKVPVIYSPAPASLDRLGCDFITDGEITLFPSLSSNSVMLEGKVNGGTFVLCFQTLRNKVCVTELTIAPGDPRNSFVLREAIRRIKEWGLA